MKRGAALRISIVTPSLNQARFLAEAIQSVQGQSYPASEHYVLDGGSVDGSVLILEDATSNRQTTTLLWESRTDGGQSAALNRGFRLATGDVIGWLNADDRYRPGCFAKVAAMFEANPKVDVLYGDYTFIDACSQHLALRREIAFSKFILNYHRVLYIPTASTFFRRRIFDEGHFLREDLHYAMDLEFFIRLSNSAYTFQHLSSTLADFRIHSQSKSSTARKQHRTEHRDIVLSSTAIARILPCRWARSAAARLLQLPAASLRYSEKLFRGYYWPEALRRNNLNRLLQPEETS